VGSPVAYAVVPAVRRLVAGQLEEWSARARPLTWGCSVTQRREDGGDVGLRHGGRLLLEQWEPQADWLDWRVSARSVCDLVKIAREADVEVQVCCELEGEHEPSQ